MDYQWNWYWLSLKLKGENNDNIYFGIKCFDSEPEKIIAREMRRDERVDDEPAADNCFNC